MHAFLLCFVPLFVAVDVVGLLPIFMGLTEDIEQRDFLGRVQRLEWMLNAEADGGRKVAALRADGNVALLDLRDVKALDRALPLRVGVGTAVGGLDEWMGLECNLDMTCETVKLCTCEIAARRKIN